MFNLLPPRRSKYYREVVRIANEEGKEAVIEYIKGLNKKQTKILMADVLDAMIDREMQYSIAEVLQAVEKEQIFLGFSNQ